MLRRIFNLIIIALFVMTGLIITNYSLPFISQSLGYDLHGNGFFGVTVASLIYWIMGIFVLAGWVLYWHRLLLITF